MSVKDRWSQKDDEFMWPLIFVLFVRYFSVWIHYAVRTPERKNCNR